jgi:hypothetical protein
MSTIESVGRRKRQSKPTHIPLPNGDTGVRNDVVANEWGESERCLNKFDKQGAPYFFAGGCKYRPIGEFRAFRAAMIVRAGREIRPRRRSSR